MLGKTPDVSEFAEFGLYDWVKFHDTTVSFPNDNVCLGRYLGPASDVGPAMTAKILKANGQVVCRTTLCTLNPEEIASDVEKESCKAFDESIRTHMGAPISKKDVADNKHNVETPTYPLYKDHTDGVQPHVPDAIDKLPDSGTRVDVYVGAEVSFLNGENMTTG